jgi:hypothetical protein
MTYEEMHMPGTPVLTLPHAEPHNLTPGQPILHNLEPPIGFSSIGNVLLKCQSEEFRSPPELTKEAYRSLLKAVARLRTTGHEASPFSRSKRGETGSGIDMPLPLPY